MDSQQTGLRRGAGFSRWTDDGQPQAENEPLELGQVKHLETGYGSAQWLENVVFEVPTIPSQVITYNFVAGVHENEGALAARHVSFDDPNALALNSPDRLLVPNEAVPTTTPSNTVPEMAMLSADSRSVDPRIPYNIDVLPESHGERRQPGSAGLESHSSSLAVIHSGSAIPDSNDGHAGSSHSTAGFDANVTKIVGNRLDTFVPISNVELPTMHDVTVPQEASQSQGNINSGSPNMNAIDPIFLEALPDDLRAEHGQGQPVDMDNASIIATFPPELREECKLNFICVDIFKAVKLI
ncbi:E3 ubiquitin-protein ligase UPL2 [Platanthera zijinensis]|uniref:E3 ubiquitin-protein ligase UPL2 n=1 Tax=Platanthera zijinensis TaxID=2320716 RepID=A0AAP0AUY0_9ASPA